MACPVCGTPLPAGARFCPSSGASQEGAEDSFARLRRYIPNQLAERVLEM